MGLAELIEQFLHQLHPFESISSTLLFIGFILCTFVQISPIKINPWDILLGWVGERFNSCINKRINEINDRVNKLEKSIDNHIEKCDIEDWKKKRQYIIDFVNEGVNGTRHTKESFENALRICDEYEDYVDSNDRIHNGVINGSISAIRMKYHEHLIKADFPEQETYISKKNADL